MDQPWEQHLVATFVRAAYASNAADPSAPAGALRISSERRDQDARRRLAPESVRLLLSGFLLVS